MPLDGVLAANYRGSFRNTRVDPLWNPLSWRRERHPAAIIHQAALSYLCLNDQNKMRNIAMLGSGFIGRFYADSIQGYRNRDRIVMIHSRQEESCLSFAHHYHVAHWTTQIETAVSHPEVDTVIIALPNHLH